MAPYTHNPNPNAFVRTMRKASNPIGFQKGYNFILWFIFAGAFFGFILARLSYLIINSLGTKLAPGEWYYYTQHFYKIGLSIHLACILPAGLLSILQFIPVIRHKARLFHRINGYTVALLLITSNIGALMIARHAFGGSLETQAAVGTLAILTTTSLILAIWNIKLLQIDQHRAWMLRTWFYAGSIITVRPIMVLSALLISKMGTYNQHMPCAKIAFTDGQEVADSYPGCSSTNNTLHTGQGVAVVHANMITPTSGIEVGAALELSFGMAMWLALALHALDIEVYLRLTPAEGERLRQVSYERQMERGMKNAGSAGLTADRLGDAEVWQPRGVEKKVEIEDAESDMEVMKPARVMRMPGQLGWN